MNRLISITGIAMAAGIFSLSAMAGNGNNAPTGPHYNLNIIGVEHAKKDHVDMTGSNRHTIFVPLVTRGKGIRSTNNEVEIHTQIWLAPGDDFRVCDGNGFDEANGCVDNPFWNSAWNVPIADCWNENDQIWEECVITSNKDGAVFELPCNNNISNDQVGFIGCDAYYQDSGLELPQANYTVWARALGSPKNDPDVTITSCATVQDELQCSTENTVQTRTKGPRPFADVTDELTSMVVDYCIAWDGDDCINWETTRIALFSGDTEDWFWNYVNNGVRLLQLRFYEN